VFEWQVTIGRTGWRKGRGADLLRKGVRRLKVEADFSG